MNVNWPLSLAISVVATLLLMLLIHAPGLLALALLVIAIIILAHTRTRRRGLLVDDMVITGDKLDLMARIKGGKGDMDGQIYVRYGILHLGVALDEGKKNFKLLKPRNWFLEQPELDETRSIEPPDAPEGLKDGG